MSFKLISWIKLIFQTRFLNIDEYYLTFKLNWLRLSRDINYLIQETKRRVVGKSVSGHIFPGTLLFILTLITAHYETFCMYPNHYKLTPKYLTNCVLLAHEVMQLVSTKCSDIYTWSDFQHLQLFSNLFYYFLDLATFY